MAKKINPKKQSQALINALGQLKTNTEALLGYTTVTVAVSYVENYIDTANALVANANLAYADLSGSGMNDNKINEELNEFLSPAAADPVSTYQQTVADEAAVETYYASNMAGNLPPVRVYNPATQRHEDGVMELTAWLDFVALLESLLLAVEPIVVT